MTRETDGESLTNEDVTIAGWAWGFEEIVTVAVSTDSGTSWSPAAVAPRNAVHRVEVAVLPT